MWLWLPVSAALLVVVPLGLRIARLHRRARQVFGKAASWPETWGTVLSTSMQVRRIGQGRCETPIVIYTYQVDGRPYQAFRVRADEDHSRTRHVGDADRTLARYPVGSNVTVYYDPTDPAMAALER